MELIAAIGNVLISLKRPRNAPQHEIGPQNEAGIAKSPYFIG
jgi:hypothetical protein